MTRMSDSKTRSVAAIGNSRVIPAKAGIQRRCGGRLTRGFADLIIPIDATTPATI